MTMRDLSGTWIGTYTYPPRRGQPTFFAARLQEHAGALIGSTEEPDVFGGNRSFSASLAGTVADGAVAFTKVYEAVSGSRFSQPVRYEGAISADGCRISGRWLLPGLSGGFEMRRRPEAQAKAAVEAETKVAEHF
jgi:hypothetical protein